MDDLLFETHAELPIDPFLELFGQEEDVARAGVGLVNDEITVFLVDGRIADREAPGPRLFEQLARQDPLPGRGTGILEVAPGAGRAQGGVFGPPLLEDVVDLGLRSLGVPWRAREDSIQDDAAPPPV